MRRLLARSSPRPPRERLALRRRRSAPACEQGIRRPFGARPRPLPHRPPPPQPSGGCHGPQPRWQRTCVASLRSSLPIPWRLLGARRRDGVWNFSALVAAALASLSVFRTFAALPTSFLRQARRRRVCCGDGVRMALPSCACSSRSVAVMSAIGFRLVPCNLAPAGSGRIEDRTRIFSVDPHIGPPEDSEKSP